MKSSAAEIRLPAIAGFCLLGALAGAPVARSACLDGPAAQPMPVATHLRDYRAGFQAPARMAPGPAGRLYVTDPGRGRVLVRADDGRVVDQGTELGNPVSVAADGAGRIFVGDGAAGRVSVYTDRWARIHDVGQGDGEFAFPGDLAVDPATGNLFVADTRAHRVKVYDPGGRPLFGFGEPGSAEGQFQFPAGIFVDAAAGEVLVADQLNYRIQIFGLDGSFRACIGATTSGFLSRTSQIEVPQGLWVDHAGRIYVADALVGAVKVIDRGGATLGTIGSFGDGPGQMRNPTDLAIDAWGRLFVASAGGGRIEMFGLDGYVDPERFVPAEIRLDETRFTRRDRRGYVTARVEIPGYALSRVPRRGVSANGIPGLGVRVGDADGNGVPDLEVRFLKAPLVARLHDGAGTVAIEGFVGNLRFSGAVPVEVVNDLPPRPAPAGPPLRAPVQP